MSFPEYIISGMWDFLVASVPLISVFFLMKICKIEGKKLLAILALQFTVSTYFWIKIKDPTVFWYQICPYIFAFICVICDLCVRKRNTNVAKEH